MKAREEGRGGKDEWKEGGKQFELESLPLSLPPLSHLPFLLVFGGQKSVRDRHLSPVLSPRLRLARRARAGELSAWLGGEDERGIPRVQRSGAPAED